MEYTPTIVITENSSEEQYQELYKLSQGDVFKTEGSYETIMRRLHEFLPENKIFKTFPITPGTSLFTIYGPLHCVVVESSEISTP